MLYIKEISTLFYAKYSEYLACNSCRQLDLFKTSTPERKQAVFYKVKSESLARNSAVSRRGQFEQTGLYNSKLSYPTIFVRAQTSNFQ